MNSKPEYRLGRVSVFFGNYQSREEFEAYFDERDDTEGNAVCPFWSDFGRTLHRMLREPVYCDSVAPVEMLPREVSFVHTFKEVVLRACKHKGIETATCGVFVFEMDYPAERLFPNPKLTFIGSFPFEHTFV